MFYVTVLFDVARNTGGGRARVFNGMFLTSPVTSGVHPTFLPRGHRTLTQTPFARLLTVVAENESREQKPDWLSEFDRVFRLALR
jgi:hypothetical protein